MMLETRFDRTVGGMLLHQLEQRGEQIALHADGESLTWHAIGERVASAVAWLDAFDVPLGGHVSILLPNGPAWAVWALAAGISGRVVVPANTKLRPDELRYQLWQSDSRVLVVPGEEHADLLDTVEEARRPGERIDAPGLEAIVAVGPTRRAWAQPYQPPAAAPLVDRAKADDVALIQYTSGTTAFPKGAMLTHAAILQDAAGVAGRLRLTADDRYFSPSPFFHSAGSTLLLYLGLVTGLSITTTARFDPERALEVIEQDRITVYGGIDALWVNLVNADGFRPDRVASLRKGWIAATGELFDRIAATAGVEGLVNLYGLSEASPNVTIADAAADHDHRRTCGLPHSGFEVRIVDPDTRDPLEPGTRGEIEVRGPCVMTGYYAKPEETVEQFSADGWLRTGDRGLLRPGGELIYEGRYKHMLRVGGENVAAAEIETVLLDHPDVTLAAVIGVPHDRLGEVPAAAVVVRDGSRVEADDVVGFAQERLAGFKVPRRVEVMDELPMTGSGRVQKFRLEQLLRA